MMPPCDVVGPSPGSGEAEAPPRSRSSLSSVVEVVNHLGPFGNVLVINDSYLWTNDS
jgi:hypothetical protein